jgi:hypothetical protein
MNRIWAFLAVLLFGSLLAGCGAASSATPFAESMKGYELYSWQDGNTWKFSLLTGTNREKSLDEETLSFPPQDIVEQVEKVCEELGLILQRTG